MKYTIRETNKFKKDVKRCIKRGLPLKELKVVFKLLEESGQLQSGALTDYAMGTT